MTDRSPACQTEPHADVTYEAMQLGEQVPEATLRATKAAANHRTVGRQCPDLEGMQHAELHCEDIVPTRPWASGQAMVRS
ncbi:hypothetical protein DN412_41115 [Cupriavidus lacunae]|uniref:Uncharacterized protein n=1 Tax=Cupriavidus lacunae TaxID=2666307 RepID=A0A370MYE2_9BURK|nr:hypothetical protein DN412_41115 [Cupriavidus lacunae]